jgi:putative ABC transport system substrate-binding protein
MIRRREVITGLGSAAAWPVVAGAQQQAVPVVGWLSALLDANSLAAFRKGLSETGYAEGRNLSIEYRSTDGNSNRLPELAEDLVRRRVAVIVTPALAATGAAKSATETIPIVFRTGNDPVQFGLVASFNRPGGNVTGIYDINEELGGKRLGLLHDLLPAVSRFALLKQNSAASESMISSVRAGAAAIGRSLEVITATNDREIEAAFGTMVQNRIDALLVQPQVLFFNRRVQLATLAAYHRVPAIYGWREHAESGGLMSYGTNLPDQFRLTGICWTHP